MAKRIPSIPMTAATTASALAAYLRTHGVAVGAVTEPTMLEDGAIEVAPFYVQVGVGYASLNRTNGISVLFGAERHDGRAILADIRAAKRELGRF